MARIIVTSQSYGEFTTATSTRADTDKHIVYTPFVDLTTLQSKLSVAPGLTSVRSVVQQALPQLPLPMPTVVHQTLTAALRIAELTCESIDRLIADEAPKKTGAFLDTGIYHLCRSAAMQRPSRHFGPGLDELVPMIQIATEYLRTLGGLDTFTGLVTDLVPALAFIHESDDLLIHRCLLATHALAEVYVRAIQSELDAANYTRAPPVARYPKDDVKHAVVRTTRGQVLGHHQIMILNCATVSDAAMSPQLAFISYRENLCFFNDWATANRKDGDILTDLNGWITQDTPAEPVWNTRPYPWRERNDIGNKLTRYLAGLDHISKDCSNVSLTHTGVLCNMPARLRKVIIASAGYGSYGFWPTPRTLKESDYTNRVSAGIGAMARGWAIDHDTEASIGEHNLFNWVCQKCAIAVTREVLYPENAAAARSDWALRIAWGPHSYFYFGMRHQGFARRVDNLLEKNPTDWRAISVRPVTPSCSPIVSGDGVPIIVTKLLLLCGVAPVDNTVSDLHLNSVDWDCHPRICSTCDFNGFRDQAFMVSVGAARLATCLPKHFRDHLVDLLDTYGFRLFPAIQSRLLVQCCCLPSWMADVMSFAYKEAGTRCGQSDCAVQAYGPRRTSLVPADEGAEYDGVQLTESLLRQARNEAAEYADKTEQVAWLNIVSKPL